VLGALYVATGRALPAPLKWGGDYNGCQAKRSRPMIIKNPGNLALLDLEKTIGAEYGLTFAQQRDLQRAGDTVAADCGAIRGSVLMVLSKLVQDQERGQ